MKSVHWGAVAIVLLAIIAGVAQSAQASAKPRALVLLDSLQTRNTHSRFFQHLSTIYDLDYKQASEPRLTLSHHGAYLYDALVHFASSATEFGEITVDDVLNFIDDGHSLLVAADSDMSDTVREIAAECGVIFEEEGTLVVDHFNFDKSDFDGDHTLVVAHNFNKNVPVITGTVKAPVLFKGIGHVLEKNNKLLLPILRASPTAYSSGAEAELNGVGKGSDVVLISALQARNNARVSFVGSLDLFSDKFYQASVEKHAADGSAVQSGNEELGKNLVSWTFGQRGVLRTSNVNHHRVGTTQRDTIYTIKENLEYTVDIEEMRDGKWVPYEASDVQLEFAMLNPYVRTFLNQTKGSAQYKAVFRLPDVYGIFTFRLNYNRPGYTSLSEIDRVTVRPLRHDQYERFIPAAYPYYAASFSMMVGLFIFSIFFLYTKEQQPTTTTTTPATTPSTSKPSKH
eukprot:TRINITY_DN1808_c0_g1_i1.p1 TRINITY_DN1808_c0_g1~~TRINITY_DN1808_c0_g1_i1.p1  ORF type:complete len:469 (-),score=86.99 TRINITY_DN1808_c0_g1_i1:58-1422(-)